MEEKHTQSIYTGRRHTPYADNLQEQKDAKV